MANIEKRGSTYRVKIRLAAGSASATFTKLTDARRWAADTESKLRAGIYFDDVPARKHTVAEAVEVYFKSPKFAKIAEPKVRRQQLGWWVERYGKLTLAKFTPAKVVEGRDELAAMGKAPATVNRYVAALSAAMTRTVRELGWITTNPCSRVDRLTEDNARERVLSDEEFGRLLDACNPDLRDLVILARYTAARRGELTGLRWSDVDITRGLVSFKATKNGTDRSVALVGPALEVLKRRNKIRCLGTDLVFPSPEDPKKPAAFRSFETAVKRAGLDGFVFHMLRHTALTRLAEAGATLSELQQIAGHKTLEMVQRYSHLCEDSTRSVMERMAQGGWQ